MGTVVSSNGNDRIKQWERSCQAMGKTLTTRFDDFIYPNEREEL